MKRHFHRFYFAATTTSAIFLKTGLLIATGFLITTGCSNSTTTIAGKAGAGTGSSVPPYSETAHADIDFESPLRLKTTSGEFISVESPGYACPTLADIDQDGDEDLIVGQFAGGNMKVYRNESGPGATPSFGSVDWISSGDKRAEVPGIS